MYAKPNPKRLAFDKARGERLSQIETCYSQHVTPQVKYVRPLARAKA